nr:5-oxoprolinase-like [Taeniopygia guttata]
MAGGLPGAPGLNLLLRRDGRLINLGGKSSVSVEPGDIFCLLTPGGGGFGPPEDGGDPPGPPEPPDPQDLWAPQNSLRPQNPGGPPGPPTPQTVLERGGDFEFRQAQEAV